MDALDVAIVRTMGVVPFGSWPHSAESLKPSFIARQVGETPDRVLDRVRAMEQAGILLGYDVHPNPRAFGMRETTFHFQVPPEGKERTLEALWETPGVFGVYDYVGEHACVQIFYESEADREAKLRRISDTAGLPEPPASYFDRPYPKPARAITPLEVRILRAMKGRARASTPEVADAVGVSARTVRRRLEAMAEDGFFDVYAWFDFGAVEGRVPVELSVRFPRAVRSELGPRVLEAAQSDLLYWWQPPSEELGAVELLVLPTSTAATERLRRRLADLDGVEHVETLLPSTARYSDAWLDELVSQHAGAVAEPARQAA
jgi:DNA-binding Lrp family transcriptional regulator